MFHHLMPDNTVSKNLLHVLPNNFNTVCITFIQFVGLFILFSVLAENVSLQQLREFGVAFKVPLGGLAGWLIG